MQRKGKMYIWNNDTKMQQYSALCKIQSSRSAQFFFWVTNRIKARDVGVGGMGRCVGGWAYPWTVLISPRKISCGYSFETFDFFNTVFNLITAHTPMSAWSSNSAVFRLKPVYFLSTSLKYMLWIPIWIASTCQCNSNEYPLHMPL